MDNGVFSYVVPSGDIAETLILRAHYVLWLLPVISAIVYVLYIRHGTTIRNLPGPFMASITQWWKVKQVLDGSQHSVYLDLHRKYGQFVRIGPNEVSISHPDGVRIIYGAGAQFRTSSWYPVFNLGGNSGKYDLLTQPDIEKHNRTKRTVSNLYSAKSINQLDALFKEPLDELLSKLDSFADRSEPVNLSDWLPWFAFDVIGLVTFSHKFGLLQAGEDPAGTLTEIEKFSKAAAVIAEIPSLAKLQILPFFRKLPIIGNYGASLNFLASKALSEISKRQKEKTSTANDILSNLLRLQKEHINEFDDLDVQILATTNIFAGADTTSVALRAILYYLIRSPRCLAKLRKELEEGWKSGQLSESPTFPEGQKMQYLQAVIKEAMRLHPSIGHNHLRVVPQGGTTIAGTYIGQNTVVGINSYVVHREKSVYGVDADDFRPERWFEDNKGAMERAFLAFGHGAHLCLGKNIALAEITKTIPLLLRRYDFSIPITTKWHGHNYGFNAQVDFIVNIERRAAAKDQDD